MTRPVCHLEDPVYWRRSKGLGVWHAFVKVGGGRHGRNPLFESLCTRHTRSRSGGAASERPEPILRCARCDIEEMRLRGWDESGPTLVSGFGPREA